MAGLVYELMDVLETQIALFDELTAFAVQKKELIVSNNTADLSLLTVGENAVVTKIQKSDKTRVTLMTDIANVLGKDKNLTLTELCGLLAGQPEHKRLYDLTERTREKIHELKVQNDQNKILVDSSLEYIEFTINTIRSSLLPEQAIYSRDGEELGVRQSFFDAKQ